MAAWEWTPAMAARLRMQAREHGRQDELIAVTGIPRATLQRIIAGKADPGPERLEKICAAIGISMESILQGGDPIPAGITQVPINDIQVSAGPGRFALDEDARIGVWPFPTDWVATHFGGSSTLRVVRVSGDSQEPELRDGDSVLIDLKETTLRDGMHVVRLDEALMIKRVQLEGSRVRLLSANPNYGDIMVDLTADQERFRVVGRAVWTGKLL